MSSMDINCFPDLPVWVLVNRAAYARGVMLDSQAFGPRTLRSHSATSTV